MKKTERESGLKTDQTVGSICGIEVFSDTRILRIAFIPVVPVLDAPKAAAMIVLLQLHPGEQMTGGIEYRYEHPDLVPPADELDLPRRWYFDNQEVPATMIAEMAKSLPTIGQGKCLDVSHWDAAKVVNAFARPIIFEGCNPLAIPTTLKKKRERESRPSADQAMGEILGIKLFVDTQILRIAVIPAHYAAVGSPGFEIDPGDADFPLAHLDQPDASNTTVMIVLLRLHPGDRIRGAYQFRYHHRDSVTPADELDLKRTRYFYLDDQGDPDTMIAEGASLLPTVREPTILDVSHLDVAEALNAFATMPFCFVRPTVN